MAGQVGSCEDRPSEDEGALGGAAGQTRRRIASQAAVQDKSAHFGGSVGTDLLGLSGEEIPTCLKVPAAPAAPIGAVGIVPVGRIEVGDDVDPLPVIASR